MKTVRNTWIVYAVFDNKVQFISNDRGHFDKLTEARLYTLRQAQAVCKKYKPYSKFSSMYNLLTVPLDVAIGMTWRALKPEGDFRSRRRKTK